MGRRKSNPNTNITETPSDKPGGEVAVGKSPRKGRGSQTWAKGEKLAFLLTLHKMFLENRGQMYTFTTREFLSRWGYDLHEDAEPQAGVNYTLVDISELPEEEREKEETRRLQIYARLRDKIANWACYRWTRQQKANSKDVDMMMDTMLEISAAPPHKKKAVQHYQNRYYETHIQADFNTYWDTIKDKIPENRRLAELNAFTEQKWKNETEEIRKEVKDAVELEYKTQLEAWESRKEWDGDALSFEQSWTKGEETACVVANSLSKILGAGISIFLWGPRAHGKMETLSVHSYPGCENRAPLNEYNEDVYREFTTFLRTYAKTVFTTEYVKSRILADTVSKNGDVDESSPVASDDTIVAGAPAQSPNKPDEVQTDAGKSSPPSSPSPVEASFGCQVDEPSAQVSPQPKDLLEPQPHLSLSLNHIPSPSAPTVPSPSNHNPVPIISTNNFNPNPINQNDALYNNVGNRTQNNDAWAVDNGSLLSFNDHRNHFDRNNFANDQLLPDFFAGNNYGDNGFVSGSLSGGFGGNNLGSVGGAGLTAGSFGIQPGSGYTMPCDTSMHPMDTGFMQMAMGVPGYGPMMNPQHGISGASASQTEVTSGENIISTSGLGGRSAMAPLPPAAIQCPEKPVAPGKENTKKRGRPTGAVVSRSSKRLRSMTANDADGIIPNAGSDGTMQIGEGGDGGIASSEPGGIGAEHHGKRKPKAPTRVLTTVAVPINSPKRKEKKGGRNGRKKTT